MAITTVSIYRECCSTTYTFDTEERAIASHVDWHNAMKRRHDDARESFIDADEKPIQPVPLREALEDFMSLLRSQRAIKCPECGAATRQDGEATVCVACEWSAWTRNI